MGFLGWLVDLGRRTSIDFGQEGLRGKTKGKLIARSLVPEARAGNAALDVGCREGIQTKWLEMKGYKVTSIDVEPKYPKGLVVDVDKPLPFRTASFDLVWCSEVIEHLENPARSVGELVRVLRPGGLLVVTTPNSRCWAYRVGSLLGYPPAKFQGVGHKQFFGIADMTRLFPGGKIYGYFPYLWLKFTITFGINFLSPTFVVAQRKAGK